MNKTIAMILIGSAAGGLGAYLFLKYRKKKCPCHEKNNAGTEVTKVAETANNQAPGQEKVSAPISAAFNADGWAVGSIPWGMG